MTGVHGLHFGQALAAWGTPQFETVLKREMARAVDALPLQQGLRVGSQVAAAPITVVIHRVSATEKQVSVRAGIFYASVIAGCSCADDPTPVGENTEYCEVELAIERPAASVRITLLDE
ncbi:hypothetical protein UT4_11980 [Ferrigenium sp. UT4]